MSEGRLGFAGAAAIGLGRMIGGGVFSVLGVVVAVVGVELLYFERESIEEGVRSVAK